MLKYRLIKEDDDIVVYHYFPEGREEYGMVTVNKKTGDVLNTELAKTDEFKRYYYHLLNEVEEFIEKNDFRSDGIIAWY